MLVTALDDAGLLVEELSDGAIGILNLSRHVVPILLAENLHGIEGFRLSDEELRRAELPFLCVNVAVFEDGNTSGSVVTFPDKLTGVGRPWGEQEKSM